MPWDPSISEEEFNRYARHQTIKGRLGVRWWGEREFRQTVVRSGLHVLEQSPYSWLDLREPLSQFVIATKGRERAIGRRPPPNPRVADIYVT